MFVSDCRPKVLEQALMLIADEVRIDYVPAKEMDNPTTPKSRLRF
jgi:hypothetical protein